MAEPHHRRMDELFRPLLLDRDGCPPAARQHLPEALGWEEVSAVADLQTVQAMVDGAARTRAPPVCSLEVGRQRVLTAGEKSPVTRECHAGIRGSPGVRFPRATRPPNKPARAGAEVVEGRGLPEGNTASETRPGHRAGSGAPSALDRVRQA